MNKPRIASIFAGVMLASLMGASTASATECVPSPPIYGEVIITPGVPAVDAVEEVSHQEYIFERTVVVQEHVPGTPAVPAELGTRIVTPEIPYAPAQYDTVIVTPAVPAQDAVYATAHQYQKQVRGVVQTRKGNGAWKKDGTFDWKWYPSTLTQWSERDVDVLQSGPHKDYLNETQNRREVTTEYRYVKNGVTKQGSLIKAAVPAKPAETKQVLVKAEQPFVPAQTEQYEITPAIPAVDEIPELTDVERTEWVREAPVGAGWEVVDQRKVVDVEAVEGIPAVDPITDTVITTPGVTCPEEPTTPVEPTEPPKEEPSTPTTPVTTPEAPKPQPQPSSTPSAPTSVVPVKAASKPSAPQAKASTESGLAYTGAEGTTLAFVAGGLVTAGGTALVLARRRRTN